MSVKELEAEQAKHEAEVLKTSAAMNKLEAPHSLEQETKELYIKITTLEKVTIKKTTLLSTKKIELETAESKVMMAEDALNQKIDEHTKIMKKLRTEHEASLMDLDN